MWKYVKKDGRPQINSDNIKYYIEDWKLVCYITDVWWDIGQLIESFKNN
jgi:hypothetical protein